MKLISKSKGGRTFNFLIKICINMNVHLSNDTPIAMLTVGQLKEILGAVNEPKVFDTTNNEKNYAYGIAGIAEIFNCSLPTANRIKASGKINKAITQIGRKIIVDVDLALELAGKKEGGRK